MERNGAIPVPVATNTARRSGCRSVKVAERLVHFHFFARTQREQEGREQAIRNAVQT